MSSSGAGARLASVQGHISGPSDLLRPSPTKASQEPEQLPYRNKSHFKYTLDEQCAEFNALTPEEREFYEENGYIIKRGIVPRWLVDKLNGHFSDLVAERIPFPPGLGVIRDIGMLRKVKAGELPQSYAKSEFGVYKLQGIFDDVQMEWVRYPELVKVARCFAGPDVKSQHHMQINKPPDVGADTSIHPLHQDYAYFPWTGPHYTVGCWTALTDVTKANGCLVVIPGSHKEGLVEHDVPRWMQGNAGFHTTRDAVWKGEGDYAEQEGRGKRKLVFAEMAPGDTIFFHPMIIHGSGFNRTKECRKSITVHYASSRSRYFPPQVHSGTVQEYIAREVLESLLKVPKAEATVDRAQQAQIDNWRNTSRIICGHDYRNELGIEDYL
ncbi:hypothetical protein DFJ74DRAFT_674746 [Hyaloraphidium curvatum]|nr:hypothetical protein DFJ74DRAFT_674746 [Hyaloraphidium curvatum]